MKYFLICILLIPTLIFGQTNQTFKVKLVDYSSDKIPAYCGYTPYATTLKFELVDNYDTLKKGQEILLIITCPRDFGIENYINNQVYTVTIYGDSEEDSKYKNYGWSIWNKYEHDKLPTFWSKELNKIE